MSIESFNRTMAYLNDIAQVGVDMTKRDGNTIGGKMQNAGTNLMGNAMATHVADSVFRDTGCSSAYMAKYTSGGDSQAALQNTMQAGYFTESLYNNRFGHCCCGGMWDSFGGGMYGNVGYNTMDPRFNSFKYNSFFNHW